MTVANPPPMKPSQVFFGLSWVIEVESNSEPFFLDRLSNSYLNERCAAHGKAKHVRHDVVDDDHHDGYDEPDEALKHVLDDQVALGDHTEQGHMGPGKQGELQEKKQLRMGNRQKIRDRLESD